MYPRYMLYLLFALSGFSGLIYESIWSQYLKLFLGSAAYAQSLVLAIFMGGMAIGAWVIGKRSKNWRNPLRAYALIEAVIGIMGLMFHQIFEISTSYAYSSLFPAWLNPGWIILSKWALASLLILPQSILLGTTFPLMAAAILRFTKKESGRAISTLYFANSLGAAFGVLVSGFWLIKYVGLPGTLATAGAINVLLAVIILTMVRRLPIRKSQPISAAATRKPLEKPFINILMAAALITGAASFIYEISWIRLLSLVLGSSSHAFELMLAAFILGLAFGGLWIRKRIDQYKNSLYALGVIQIVMGFFAILTIPIYDQTIDVMQWTMSTLSKSEASYTMFNVISHILAGAVMMPVTFLAGMTLPLITYTLYRNGLGEQSVGTVYAYNTLGAIIGVLVAVHVLLPALGLRLSLFFGASLDLALGVFLLYQIQPRKRIAYVALTGTGAVLLAIGIFRLDPLRLASGVYRHGSILSAELDKILFSQDGKTASVTMVRHPGDLLSIRTNGKPDASIRMNTVGKPSSDESTMILAAALPLSIHKNPRRVGNIGMGSGLTTHTLLYSPVIERVETIEIEPLMVEAARGFGNRVHQAYDDPRSHIYFDDAKTFFSSMQPRYDILIAEPSNPWVSGVSSLFTKEFYQTVNRHLQPDGLFVQWLQLYETQLPIVASVMKALGDNFAHYTVYVSEQKDMLIIASANSIEQPGQVNIFSIKSMQRELGRLSIFTDEDLRLRMVGTKSSLAPLFSSYNVIANSDYYPILDIYAPQARFMASNAEELGMLRLTMHPLIEMLDSKTKETSKQTVAPLDNSELLMDSRVLFKQAARQIRDYYTQRRNTLSASPNLPPGLHRDVLLVRLVAKDCRMDSDWTLWKSALMNVMGVIAPQLPAHEVAHIWSSLNLEQCSQRLNRHQRQWHALIKAVGLRSAETMIASADTILKEADPALTDSDRRYAVFSVVLGYLAKRDAKNAASMLDKHRQIIDSAEAPLDKLTVRYLRAHAKMPQTFPPNLIDRVTATQLSN